jgi:FAD/FMN-containing dehydrogenase
MASIGGMSILLRNGFKGRVWTPGEDGYETGRLSWHRAIDPRPAMVAEASDAWDVLAAIAAAREHELPFAVQSTGHGTVTPADGALLLKTSLLDKVEVDPECRVARVGAGALWSDVIDAAAPYDLAPLAGTAAIGVAGYTLGGGAGWLSRKHGYAADSLRRADVVTADGRAVVASPRENADLFWALRGGGANFGVLTSLEFRLYPVSRLWGGMSFHNIERAKETIACYREWALAEPDDLNTAVMLLQMPPDPQLPEAVRGKRLLAIRALYIGSGHDAEWLLDPLFDAAGERVAGGFRQMSFDETGTITGPAPAATAARQHIDLFGQLPDGLIDVLLEPSPLAGVEIRHWGGAMGRTSADAGPIGHRHVPFSVVAVAPFTDPASRHAVESTMDDLAARLRPYATGGTFLNFLTDPSRTHTAYTSEDYQRLLEVKRVWDPDNFFNLNHNISAAAAGSR